MGLSTPRSGGGGAAQGYPNQSSGARSTSALRTRAESAVCCRFREGAGPIKFQLHRVTCDEAQQRASVEWRAALESRDQQIVGVSMLQFEEGKIAETAVYRQTT